MKRILLSTIMAAGMAMSSAAFAEPKKLSDQQLDKVTAAGLINFNLTSQQAVAAAVSGPAVNACVIAICKQNAQSNATAVAVNTNKTVQVNRTW